MFRQIVVVTCDICGQTKESKTVTTPTTGMTAQTIPDGWTVAKGNPTVHLCPACTRKLEGWNHRG